MKRSRRLTTALGAGAFARAGVAFADLVDTASHTPPSYFNFAPPAAGGSYVDPVFGTTVRRLSNAPSMSDNAGGGQLPWVMTEYSTMSAFNRDNTRFVLQHGSYYGLYDGAGSYLGDLPFEIHASAEPRWSRTDANVIHYLSGNQVRSYNLATQAVTVRRTFGEYGEISGHGESDIGFAGDRLVLAGNGRHVFVYDIATNQKGPTFDALSHGGWDAIYLTPDGNVLISWYSHGLGRYQGIELYDSNMTFRRQVASAGGHMDVTRDADGAEVLVWTNSADPAPICDNGIVKVRLANGAQSCLLSLDWSLAVHIGCPDGAGFCIVGTDAPSDPNPAGGWPAYTNELLRVPLDGSVTHRLLHHRSRPFDGYNYMPRATVSRDGSRMLFGSNFGLQAHHPLIDEYSDAYMVELAAGTGGGSGGGDTGGGDTGGGDTGGGGEDDGGGGLLQEDAPAVTETGTWHDNVGDQHSGGAAILSMDRGSSVVVNFQGTGIRWIGLRDEWSGRARVLLDGEVVRNRLDTYASPAAAQQVLYAVDGLPNGNHTLEVRVLGSHSSQSDGDWVWIDAFEVLGGQSGSTPPENGPVLIADPPAVPVQDWTQLRLDPW